MPQKLLRVVISQFTFIIYHLTFLQQFNFKDAN